MLLDHTGGVVDLGTVLYEVGGRQSPQEIRESRLMSFDFVP